MEGEKTEGGQDVCHDSCTGSFNGTIRDDCMQMSRDITKIACLLKVFTSPSMAVRPSTLRNDHGRTHV